MVTRSVGLNVDHVPPVSATRRIVSVKWPDAAEYHGARLSAEQRRLLEDQQRIKHWKRWGPYLSERAWGTVREDYSPGGTAWEYFPHDHARSRAYRWNEDGLGGICDRHQHICLSFAFWNGRDPILKERLFGLTGNEGNHGEDVKEYYFYLDSTPTHSYMRWLYKYPQAPYPYSELVAENARRGRAKSEYELVDTGVFDSGRYFDIEVEYAKADPEDLLIRIMVHQPRTGRRADPRVADGVVPQHMVVATEPAQASAPRRAGDSRQQRNRARRTALRLAVVVLRARRAAALSPRTKRTRSVFSAWALPGFSRTASTISSSTASASTVNPANQGTKAAAHYQLHGSRGRQRHAADSVHRPRARVVRRRRRSTRTRCRRSPIVALRRTSSTR